MYYYYLATPKGQKLFSRARPKGQKNFSRGLWDDPPVASLSLPMAYETYETAECG